MLLRVESTGTSALRWVTRDRNLPWLQDRELDAVFHNEAAFPAWSSMKARWSGGFTAYLRPYKQAHDLQQSPRFFFKMSMTCDMANPARMFLYVISPDGFIMLYEFAVFHHAIRSIDATYQILSCYPTRMMLHV